jgi:CHASE1-domain containing sensor protein
MTRKILTGFFILFSSVNILNAQTADLTSVDEFFKVTSTLKEGKEISAKQWKEFAPWPEDAQEEQDLVIEKALLELFASPFLQERLAFRGGTALHKSFLKPQVRY